MAHELKGISLNHFPEDNQVKVSDEVVEGQYKIARVDVGKVALISVLNMETGNNTAHRITSEERYRVPERHKLNLVDNDLEAA
ncbi:hypothetical protein KW801_01015 [Candidatus Saccharibacteria bacterium]|nr:hypothetical protein [Candidatus Saccharibacteria bacterium]